MKYNKSDVRSTLSDENLENTFREKNINRQNSRIGKGNDKFIEDSIR